MRFEPLWGLVNDSYETTAGFHTVRSKSLRLPTSPIVSSKFGGDKGYDSLAATGGLLGRLGVLYKQRTVGALDYSGKTEFRLCERWSRLSQNETSASKIPILTLTDGLAAGRVGTKTSFSSERIDWPASLAVDNGERGYPRNKVQTYRQVLHDDIQYAIPFLVALTVVFLALAGAITSSILTPSIIRTMQRLYNQTSAGRLATGLLEPYKNDPTQSTDAWIQGQGRLSLLFGMSNAPEQSFICKLTGHETSDTEPAPAADNGAREAEEQQLLPRAVQ